MNYSLTILFFINRYLLLKFNLRVSYYAKVRKENAKVRRVTPAESYYAKLPLDLVLQFLSIFRELIKRLLYAAIT